MWWLFKCGNPEHAGMIEQRLGDDYFLVRATALRALSRLGDTSACDSLERMLKDDSVEVQIRAREYESLCR